MLDAYERVFSQGPTEYTSGCDTSRIEKAIEQAADRAKRWSQMKLVVQGRLEKTERQDNLSRLLARRCTVSPVKDARSSALQAVYYSLILDPGQTVVVSEASFAPGLPPRN